MPAKTVGEFRAFLERFDQDLPLEIRSERNWDTRDWEQAVYESISRRDGQHYVSIGDWAKDNYAGADEVVP